MTASTSNMLVSCSSDLKFHHGPNFDVVQVYKPSTRAKGIRDISWCKDGSLLGVVPIKGNGEIVKTSVDDVHLLFPVDGIPSPSAISFQRTSKKYAAVGTSSGVIYMYDIKDKNIRKKLASIESSVKALDFCYRDTHLAASCENGEIALYNNTNNVRTATYSVRKSKTISAMRFHNTQRQFLGCAGDEGSVVIWNINTGKELCYIPQVHNAPVTGLSFSAVNSSLLITVSLDRTFHLFDTASSVNPVLTKTTTHPLCSVDLHPVDGSIVALGTTRGGIYVYDLRYHEEPLLTLSSHGSEVHHVRFQQASTGRSITSNALLKKDSSTLPPEKGEPQMYPTPRSVCQTEQDSLTELLSNSGSPLAIKSSNLTNIHSSQSAVSTSHCSDYLVELLMSSSANSGAGDSLQSGIASGEPNKGSENFTKKDLKNLEITKNVLKLMSSGSEEQIKVGDSQTPLPCTSIPRTSQMTSTPNLNIVVSKAEDLVKSTVSPIISMNGNTKLFSEVDFGQLQRSVESVQTSVEDLQKSVECRFSILEEVIDKRFMSLILEMVKRSVMQEKNKAYLAELIQHKNSEGQTGTGFDMLKAENTFLKKNCDNLRQEIEELRKDNERMKEFNDKIRTENECLKNESLQQIKNKFANGKGTS